eukprot:9491754-Pyramimonas_sp.AAC.1
MWSGGDEPSAERLSVAHDPLGSSTPPYVDFFTSRASGLKFTGLSITRECTLLSLELLSPSS